MAPNLRAISRPAPSRAKRLIATAFAWTGLGERGSSIHQLLTGPNARALNYHDVPPTQAGLFEAQVAYFAANYDILDAQALRELLAGERTTRRPGILLTFDDALRSHAEVVAPILDRFGVAGWFMIPVGFVETDTELQREFAAKHRVSHEGYPYRDARIAMTWAQVRELAARHEICCHTWNHIRLDSSVSYDMALVETLEAKKRLEVEIAREVRAFAWVGGERKSYSRAGAAAIKTAGFKWSFMTNNQLIRAGSPSTQLQRTNVEATDPLHVVKFQLSGAMDLLYWRKRAMVNRLTRQV